MCDMQRFLKDLRVAILNFRLDLCCFVFSVRAGILLFGCFNVISSMVCLIAVATGAVTPLLANTQQGYSDGEYVHSTCAFAYSSDLCLAVLLLCGLYRKDIVLLRYYTYCGLAMLGSTVLVYSMVIGILSVLHTIMVATSLAYQIYVIILVRSLIVELKVESKRPYYYYPNHPIYWKPYDIEAANDPVESYEMRELVNKRKTSVVKPAIGIPKQTETEEAKETTKSESKTKEKVEDIEATCKQVKESNLQPETKGKNKDNVQPTTSIVKINVETKASEEPKDQPTTSKVKDTTEPKTVETKTNETVKDAIGTKTSETIKEDTKLETSEKPKVLRYPYKFIAIKIPKEAPIKEEKENEDKEKERDKDVKEIDKDADSKKEEPIEITKETKKRKRSIFGRKIKNKSEESDNEEKKVEKKT